MLESQKLSSSTALLHCVNICMGIFFLLAIDESWLLHRVAECSNLAEKQWLTRSSTETFSGVQHVLCMPSCFVTSCTLTVSYVLTVIALPYFMSAFPKKNVLSYLSNCD